MFFIVLKEVPYIHVIGIDDDLSAAVCIYLYALDCGAGNAIFGVAYGNLIIAYAECSVRCISISAHGFTAVIGISSCYHHTGGIELLAFFILSFSRCCCDAYRVKAYCCRLRTAVCTYAYGLLRCAGDAVFGVAYGYLIITYAECSVRCISISAHCLAALVCISCCYNHAGGIELLAFLILSLRRRCSDRDGIKTYCLF